MASTTKKSGTSAAKKPARIAYGVAASDATGVIYSAQSAAGRSEKAAVIVRYASRAGLDGSGEIVHEHGAKFQGMWISSAGICHAVSQDGAWHSNEGSSWKVARLTKKPLVAVGGGPDLVLASGNGPALFMRRDGAWTEQDTGMSAGGVEFFGSLATSAADDVYVAGTGGLAHFDGTTWHTLKHEAGPKAVVAISADEVYVASFTGLFRGNARSGFECVAQRKLQYACSYQGDLYCCAYSGGIFRWKGGTLEPSSDSDVAIAQLAGDPGRVLCGLAGMQDGLWVFDGTTWSKSAPS